MAKEPAKKSTKETKLSTDPYRGVRDFYPEDMLIEKYIFSIWETIAKKFGYEEYSASILEPAELYKAKSGEEIVNEQTYTFTDRGDREVTLRPEMTPTLARMVAGKKRELVFPLRYFSIPNLFRYENPQRGRLREHYQLNVDIFGITGIEAETEIIKIAYEITKAYGLIDEQFEIRINNRKTFNFISKQTLGLDDADSTRLAKLIDKKAKLSKEDFDKKAKEILGKKTDAFLNIISADKFPIKATDENGLQAVEELLKTLAKLGIKNARFDPTLMRGFDYYTGIVFEVFDKDPTNKRSVFGGGRYDDLLSIFGGEKVTAVGFGAGDVVAKDLLETYNSDVLERSRAGRTVDIYMCVITPNERDYALALADKLRKEGRSIAVDSTYRKVGDQIKTADRKRIAKVIVIGEMEAKNGKFKIKNLANGTEDEQEWHA